VFGCSLFAPGDRAQGHEPHEATHAHPHAN
jgi:hypothetical protein